MSASEVITIELRPPSWWNRLRLAFTVFGVLNIVLGLGLAALVTWLTPAGGSVEVMPLVVGVFVAAVGAFLVQQLRKTARYRAMPLVLEETHAVLPRLRTNEAVCVSYEDIRKILLLRIPALRMRVFLRTAQGDFFVHRSWLPQAWTLEKLAAELARRRAAANARPAAGDTGP